MNIVVTLLIYAGIPLAIVALLFALVYLPGEVKRGTHTRYRPGRPWEYKPLWYLPHPVDAGNPPALTGHNQAAIEGAHENLAEPALVEAIGGASGEW